MFKLNQFWVWGIAIVSGIALLLAAGWYGYTNGYTKGNNKATKRIAEYERQLEELRTEISQNVNNNNVEIVTVFKDREKEIEVEKIVYRNIIETVKEYVPIPAECNLSQGWVNLHDAAALNVALGDQSIGDFSVPSNKNAYDALSTVTENYAVCKTNAARLDAIQTWVKESYKAVNQKELEYE